MGRFSIVGVTAGLVVICCLGSLGISDDGKGGQGCHQRCRHIHRRRVCGSDGYIYRNLCQLQKSACLNGEQLEKVPDSWCKLSLELKDDDNSDDQDHDESNSSEDSKEGRRRRPTGPDGFTLVPSTAEPNTQQMITPPVLWTTKSTSDSDEPSSTEDDPSTAQMVTTKRNILTTQTGTTRIPTTSNHVTTMVPTVPKTTKVLTTLIKTTRAPTTRPQTTTPRVCPSVCPLVLEPVCGTDGLTYTSVCVLQAEACLNTDNTLQVAYDGPCIATLNPVEPQK